MRVRETSDGRNSVECGSRTRKSELCLHAKHDWPPDQLGETTGRTRGNWGKKMSLHQISAHSCASEAANKKRRLFVLLSFCPFLPCQILSGLKKRRDRKKPIAVVAALCLLYLGYALSISVFFSQKVRRQNERRDG